MVSKFLFDIGNVIVRFDYSLVQQRIQKNTDREISNSDWEKLFDISQCMEVGKIEWDEFFNLVLKVIPYSENSDKMKQDYNDIFVINVKIANVIKNLKTKNIDNALYLLSNTSHVHLNFLKKQFDIFKYFDGGVFSFEEKSLKPDVEIYKNAIKKYDLIPEETIYIDDLEANIKSGEKLGFISHQYSHERHDELLKFFSENNIKSFVNT